MCDCRRVREPDESKFAAGFTYHRFGNGEKCAIHRLGVEPSGRVAAKWAYGAWRDAEHLEYAHEINETTEVEE